MYNPVFWEDRIAQYPRRVSVVDVENGLKEWKPAPGEIIKNGTQQSSRNFGNMDFGILESALMNGYMAQILRIVSDHVEDLSGQYLKATLKNTYPYPASNAESTVTLPVMVNNTDYTVTAEVLESDGYIDRITVYGKALNAFKVKYYGSAKNVTLRLHVIGGMY